MDEYNEAIEERDANVRREIKEKHADMLAERERLRSACMLARNTFEGYAAMHREKHTADGDAKAALNAELAACMNAALSPPNT